jgi:hypothetical protein
MARFTADNARLMTARALEARARNREARRQQAAEAEAKAKAQAQQPTIPSPIPPDTYLAERLTRVRKQLDAIDAMLLGEADPQRLDRLAAASARLCEQERQLAGRPLPGSYRPVQRRERNPGAGGASAGPLDVE